MELLEAFILFATLSQSLTTGTFLTLDVANKDLQKEWGFTSDKMVSVGTVGYSLGFLFTAFYGLYINNITPKISILIGGLITTFSWAAIYFTLCNNCIEWVYAMLFEAGIGCGTALSYLASVQIITKSNHGNTRKIKLIFLALFVAIGSIIAFIIFVDLNRIKLTILIMLGFAFISTVLVFVASFLIKPEIIVDLPTLGLPREKSFSSPFGMYLFALNLTFGVIMTFINSANGVLDSFEEKWDTYNNKTQLPLICFVLGNFIGRLGGIFLRSYLDYMLYLFGFFSLMLGILQSFLLLNWNIIIVFTILCTSAIFFGIIWAISMPLAREFFGIREDKALGLIFFGMSIFPMAFGLLASWLYKYRQNYLGTICNYSCFWTYLCISTMATYLSVFAYGASWYLRKNERLKAPDNL
jgi:MFS family permease